jgi:hypothetical protein
MFECRPLVCDPSGSGRNSCRARSMLGRRVPSSAKPPRPHTTILLWLTIRREGATWRTLRYEMIPTSALSLGPHPCSQGWQIRSGVRDHRRVAGVPRRTERQNKCGPRRQDEGRAGPVRIDGSKGTQLNGSADLGFLDAAKELRRLQTPIPSKAEWRPLNGPSGTIR